VYGDCGQVLEVADVYDFIGPAAETLYQALIEVELTATIGAVLELVGRAEPLTDERLDIVDDDEPGAGLSRRANR
jgi:hypothetical protein